ncbi:hypothetical protein TcasGA2_TC034568 [Tribolium castaneum]|uniref:Uncharacterized protein n=1 Tax=Tribolium castaneum TaxID=7070 RepID=A0A139WM73_TRICA|nr:hypothetical protein TcasGA2_TC034568 [Tribolium castaneum]
MILSVTLFSRDASVVLQYSIITRGLLNTCWLPCSCVDEA